MVVIHMVPIIQHFDGVCCKMLLGHASIFLKQVCIDRKGDKKIPCVLCEIIPVDAQNEILTAHKRKMPFVCGSLCITETPHG